MSDRLGVGLALALGSAAALNWGFFAQHGAASGLSALSLRSPFRSLRVLFSSRRWVVGFATGLAGWALYVAALALAPLSLVQAVSAGGVGLLALLVAAGGVQLGRVEWAGVACAVGGLAVLGVSLGGQSARGGGGSWPGVTAWVAASVVAAGLASGRGAGLLRGGAGFGVAAGILYAAGDVATKAAAAGTARLVFVPVILACHGLAFVCIQLGFQRGGALATAGIATLLTNGLPIVAGTALFGEGIPAGALGALRILSFVAVVAGGAVLAAPEASSTVEPRALVAAR